MQGPDSLLTSVIEVVVLGRRAMRNRFAVLRHDIDSRVQALALAAVLAVMVVVLVAIALVLGAQAGVLGLQALGLRPVFALLAAAGICVLLVTILGLWARAALRRALRPLPASALIGDLPPPSV